MKSFELTEQPCNPSTAWGMYCKCASLYTPFEYEDFITIHPNGGNIGRFFWDNGTVLECYYQAPDGKLIKEFDRVIPGSCAFIQDLWDWIAWTQC